MIVQSKARELESEMEQQDQIDEDQTRDERATCEVCSKSYKTLKIMNQHKKTHQNQFVRCEICDKTFKSKKTLRQHMGLHNGILTKKHQCSYCDKAFYQGSDLRRHTRIHTNEKPFKCTFCLKEFNNETNYRTHVKRHDPDNMDNKCTICNKSFVSPKTLQKHMEIGVHNSETHTCNICNATFETRISFSGHQVQVHKPEEGSPFQCRKCDKHYPSYLRLNYHAVVHNKPEFVCHVCGRAFHYKVDLTEHDRTHTGLKKKRPDDGKKVVLPKSECNICGLIVLKRNLSNHKKHHTNEKTHECFICQKKFVRKTHLEGHMKYHTNTNMLDCEKCDKQFHRKVNLKKHMLSHDREKKFSCQFCGTKFRYPFNLRAHCIRFHAAELDQEARNDACKSVKYSCQSCGTVFGSVERLKLHKETECQQPMLNQEPVEESEEVILAEILIESAEVISAESSNTDEVSSMIESEYDNAECESDDQENEAALSGTEVDQNDSVYVFCEIPEEKPEDPSIIKIEVRQESQVVIEEIKIEEPSDLCSEIEIKPEEIAIEESKPTITANTETQFKCSICQKSYSKKLYLTRHVKRHKNLRPHHCRVCKKSFGKVETLKKHQTSLYHNEVSSLSRFCSKCNITLNTTDFLSHDQDHGKDIKIICSFCPLQFEIPNEVNVHIRKFHESLEGFLCFTCGKKYKGAATLQTHIYKSHAPAGAVRKTYKKRKPEPKARPDCRFECPECDKSFLTEKYLKLHRNLHSGKNLLTCSVCDKKCVNKTHLNDHLSSHSKNYQFECDVCKKSFVRKSHLNSHKLTHTGKKSFSCEICGSGFLRSDNLRQHMRIHLGDKRRKRNKSTL